MVNPAAVVFGPVIVVMVLFNLLAMIVLLCSAWAGERSADGPEETTGSEDREECPPSELPTQRSSCQSMVRRRESELG